MKLHGLLRGAGLSVALATVAGCSADPAPPEIEPRTLPLMPAPNVMKVDAPLAAAYCDVTVEGAGTIDLEEDYLPNVVRCENGGANLEALKAQAIAARSVAYYAMETDGSICDSQGCQVYTCAGSAEAIHIQAVEETSGMYLKYGDILTYGFYVAGDNNVSSPSCIGAPGGAPTEQWVTYNEGNNGTDVTQTALGFVHQTTDPGYGQNRGCMGQWAARCLENDNGYDHVDILRFFYGDDIEIVQAVGVCVLEVDPTGDGGEDTGPSDEGGTTSAGVDDGDDEAGDSGGPLDGGGDDAADADGAGDDGAGADDGADGGADDGADGGGDDGAGDGGDGGAAGTGAVGGGPGSLPQAFGEDAYQDGGCACSLDGDAPTRAPGWMALVGLLLVRRGRRRNDRRPSA
ncbi:MAG: SpoIID/LytB domain-containing protein [Myxococcota bacterium]